MPLLGATRDPSLRQYQGSRCQKRTQLSVAKMRYGLSEALDMPTGSEIRKYEKCRTNRLLLEKRDEMT